MRIHLLSDLHLEIESDFTPEILDVDVTILAGDIAKGDDAVHWARRHFSGRVLIVPGNHEFYGGHLQHTLAAMRAAADARVQVLDRDEVVIDGVRFLGATAWTDFSSTGDVEEALEWCYAMSDFAAIRTDRGEGSNVTIKPADLVSENHMTRAWFEQKLLNERFSGKTVVITHHAPAWATMEAYRLMLGKARVTQVPIPSRAYQRPHLRAGYLNRWDDLLPYADLWCHGHLHLALDWPVGNSRIWCNPRGYGDNIERTDCDLRKVIEL